MKNKTEWRESHIKDKAQRYIFMVCFYYLGQYLHTPITLALGLATTGNHPQRISIYKFCTRPQTAANVHWNFQLQDPQSTGTLFKTQKSGPVALLVLSRTAIRASDQLVNGPPCGRIHSCTGGG